MNKQTATVLMYQLEGTTKGQELTMLFSFLGYQIRHVKAGEYHLPLKELLDSSIKSVSVPALPVAPFSREMLVLCMDTDAQQEKALFLMKQEKLYVDLKAVLTDTNQHWNSSQLFQELSLEHQMLHQTTNGLAK